MLNPFIEQDYLSEARERVTEQFKYDPVSDTGAKVFDKYLQLLINAQVEIQKVFKAVSYTHLTLPTTPYV